MNEIKKLVELRALWVKKAKEGMSERLKKELTQQILHVRAEVERMRG